MLRLSTDTTLKDRFFKNAQMFDPTKPQIPYSLVQPSQISLKYYDPTKTQTPKGVLFEFPNQCGLHGFQNPYS